MTKASAINSSDFVPANSNGAINEIIRGEISAIEAYQQVFYDIDNEAQLTHLEQMMKDHYRAVDYWRRQAVLELSKPENDSGVWGSTVETFVGASKLLGNRAALTALKKGEELGLENYRSILERPEFTSSQKQEVREKFIPAQEEHIANLSALIKMH